MVGDVPEQQRARSCRPTGPAPTWASSGLGLAEEGVEVVEALADVGVVVEVEQRLGGRVELGVELRARSAAP